MRGQDALRRHRVVQLFSPPRTPRYNGAIEASIGVPAHLSGHMALANGHPGQLAIADLEMARQAANAREDRARGRQPAAQREHRSYGRQPASHSVSMADSEYPDAAASSIGLAHCTPQARWHARVPIRDTQRAAFLAAVAGAISSETRAMLQRRTASPKRRGAQGAAQRNANQRPADALPAQVSLDRIDWATVARRAIRRALLALGYLAARRPADISTQKSVDVHGN